MEQEMLLQLFSWHLFQAVLWWWGILLIYLSFNIPTRMQQTTSEYKKNIYMAIIIALGIYIASWLFVSNFFCNWGSTMYVNYAYNCGIYNFIAWLQGMSLVIWIFTFWIPYILYVIMWYKIQKIIYSYYKEQQTLYRFLVYICSVIVWLLPIWLIIFAILRIK